MKILKQTALALALTSTASLMTYSAPAQAADMSAEDKQAFQEVIREYLLSNPEVVVEAIRKYQTDQEAARAKAAKERLSELREPLERAEGTPVLGNPDGDVTIVEFFDYRCGYCKRVHDDLMKAMTEDGKVRLVMKEFPILGPASVFASRAALAVFYIAPEKYEAFHNAMMTSRGDLDENRVLDIAASMGLDADAIKEGIKDPRVETEIQHNMALAQALEITGTPAFVIGNELVPGAIDRAAIDELIAQVRGG